MLFTQFDFTAGFDTVVSFLSLSLFKTPYPLELGFPGGLVVKNLPISVGGLGLIPGAGEMPLKRKWLLTPVFLLGKSHGQRSLAGYSPWG